MTLNQTKSVNMDSNVIIDGQLVVDSGYVSAQSGCANFTGGTILACDTFLTGRLRVWDEPITGETSICSPVATFTRATVGTATFTGNLTASSTATFSGEVTMNTMKLVQTLGGTDVTAKWSTAAAPVLTIGNYYFTFTAGASTFRVPCFPTT